MSITSIIIPTCNGLPLLISCLESIRQYTDSPYEIIVVDNGSSDGTLDYCRNEKIVFISLPTNTDFSIMCNLGMATAVGEQILLLNHDVIVSQGWLNNMLSALYSEEKIGMVGPVTSNMIGTQEVACDYEDMQRFHQLAGQWNIPDSSKWQVTDHIGGFCFLFRRVLMDTIGMLDVRYSPEYFEDDDYCCRARSNGYKLLMCGDVLVHHEGSHAFRKDIQEEGVISSQEIIL